MSSTIMHIRIRMQESRLADFFLHCAWVKLHLDPGLTLSCDLMIFS